MSKATDPAQMLVLAFEDIASAMWAVRDLRTLRSCGEISAESVAVIESQASGNWSYTVEPADLSSAEGALIATLADVLMGTFTDRQVEACVRGSVGASGKKIATKRIDRGICSARLKPLYNYFLPGNSVIVALVRESEMARLVGALADARTIAHAREVWVDLELDLDLLIADVLGPNAAFSPVTLGAGLLAMASSQAEAETAQVSF